MKNPEDQSARDKSGKSPDELLGDLESIKELLDEEQGRDTSQGRDKSQGRDESQVDDESQARDENAEREAANVPLLDDMVDGAYTLEESSFLLSAQPVLGGGRRSEETGRARQAGDVPGRYMSEDLFDALLGDRWKASASDILTEARGAIEAHRNDWAPEDTDELNEALRVRIDETLTEWLKETVRARMDELHAALLQTAEATINEKIQTLIDSRRAAAFDDDPLSDQDHPVDPDA